MNQEFSEEQIKYLSLMTKYSGRKDRVEVIKTYDKPQMKLSYIRQNFNNLTIAQQVEFNDQMDNMRNIKQFSLNLGLGLFIGSAIYFIVITPATKSLTKPFFKCLGGSTFLAYTYYKYQQKFHYEWLQQRYTQIHIKDKK